jgi:hypothetical protein
MTYVPPETWSSLTCGRAILNRPRSSGPHDAGFTEPWQAEALALSIALQESGLLSPAEWSNTLGEEIEKARAAGDPADGRPITNTSSLPWNG